MEFIFDERTKDALLQKLHEDSKSAVRIVIKGIGWGVPKLGIVLDEQKKHDLVYIFDEIKFVVINAYSNLSGKYIVNYRTDLSVDTFTLTRV